MNLKLNKKRIVVIVISIIIVLFIILGVIFNYQFNKKKSINKSVIFNEDRTLEAGEILDISKYIKEVIGGELVTDEIQIDTTKVGTLELKVKVKDANNEVEEFPLYIDIVDTTKPEITCKDIIEINQGEQIDLLQDVTSKDSIDGELEVKVDGEYDINVPGEYKLKYVSQDKSGNIQEKEFTLKIIAKEITDNNSNSDNNKTNTVEKTNTDNTNNNNNSNTNNNNTNSKQVEKSDNSSNSTTNKNVTTTNRGSTTTGNKTVSSNNKTESSSNKKQPAKELADTGSFSQSDAKSMVAMINNARKEAGSGDLVWDSNLESLAKTRAKELVNSFSHNRPSGAKAENIAYGISSTSTLFSKWMGSSTHKKNMMRASYTKVGIAKYVNNGICYWVLLAA